MHTRSLPLLRAAADTRSDDQNSRPGTTLPVARPCATTEKRKRKLYRSVIRLLRRTLPSREHFPLLRPSELRLQFSRGNSLDRENTSDGFASSVLVASPVGQPRLYFSTPCSEESAHFASPGNVASASSSITLEPLPLLERSWNCVPSSSQYTSDQRNAQLWYGAWSPF